MEKTGEVTMMMVGGVSAGRRFFLWPCASRLPTTQAAFFHHYANPLASLTAASACSLLHQWKKSSVKTATVSHDAMVSNATVQLVMAVLTCVTDLPAGLTRSSAAALSAPNNAAPKEQSQADAVLFFAPIRQSVVASF